MQQDVATETGQLPLFALSRARTGDLDDRSTNPSFPKAAEIIEIVNVKGDELTLFDRKLYNFLLFHAYQELGKKKVHKVPIRWVRGTHKSADRILDSVQRLMRTIMRINYFGRKDSLVPEGSHNIQLLGPTKVEGRYLHYRILEELVDVLRNPRIYGRINFGVQDCLSSKYGLILYEHLQARLHWVQQGTGAWKVTVEDLRQLFECVDKFSNFKDFRKRVLAMAVDDVNQHTEWSVSWTETKRSRAVHEIAFTFELRSAPVPIEISTDDGLAIGALEDFTTLPVLDTARNRAGVATLRDMGKTDLVRWYQLARQTANEVEGCDILSMTKPHQIGQWVQYVVDELETAGLLAAG